MDHTMVKPVDNTELSVENVMVIQLLEDVKGPRAPAPELPELNGAEVVLLPNTDM